jgi:transcriptional regulator
MYVPAEYQPPDPDWVRELMMENPLALLATNGVEAPYATHVPVILRGRHAPGSSAGLAGSTLVGHMNRANPHWTALAGGISALLAFTGPHGYVSPSVYGTTPAAPTWDFTSVHVRGPLRRIEDPNPTLGVIIATVRAFESRFGRGWDLRPSLGYFRKILPGVGAFEVEIETVEAMFKLSQEQSPEVRCKVARSFAASGSDAARPLANLIGRFEQVSEGNGPPRA